MPQSIPAAAPHTEPAAAPRPGLIGWIERRPQAAFGGFLALHFVVWTALPALFYANLPLDLIEALTYGREWQLGYDKLPPLPWWLVEILHRTIGADVAYYALAQAVVLIAFALVFATARPLVGATGALVAVLIIDGLHYFQYTAVKFNHDVVQLPFWALAAYAFHAALKRGRLGHWILLGVGFGGALWAKYFVIVLAAPYALFMLFDREARRALATPGPWLALAIALLIASPHVMWLFQTDFLPFAYASHRAAPVRGWFDHILHPAMFAGSQIFFALPSLFIAAGLFWPKAKATPLPGRLVADTFDRRIVTLLALGPGLATIALIAVSGRGAVAMWGYPLWLYLGLWIVMAARAPLDAARAVGNHELADRYQLHRQLCGAAVFRPPLPRCVVSRRQARRRADTALSHSDRRTAALCRRLDVGRWQSRALFAGPAAGLDRRRAATHAMDRSQRFAQQRRRRGVDAGRHHTAAAAIRRGRGQRRNWRAVRSADAPRRWRGSCRLGDLKAASSLGRSVSSFQ